MYALHCSLLSVFHSHQQQLNTGVRSTCIFQPSRRPKLAKGIRKSHPHEYMLLPERIARRRPRVLFDFQAAAEFLMFRYLRSNEEPNYTMHKLSMDVSTFVPFKQSRFEQHVVTSFNEDTQKSRKGGSILAGILRKIILSNNVISFAALRRFLFIVP